MHSFPDTQARGARIRLGVTQCSGLLGSLAHSFQHTSCGKPSGQSRGFCGVQSSYRWLAPHFRRNYSIAGARPSMLAACRVVWGWRKSCPKPSLTGSSSGASVRRVESFLSLEECLHSTTDSVVQKNCKRKNQIQEKPLMAEALAVSGK